MMRSRAGGSIFSSPRAALVAGFLALPCAAADAANVQIIGSVSVTPSLFGSYVTLAADRVENFDYFGYSGTLRLEYWAFSHPFTGSDQFGYSMAIASLGQLPAGYYFYGISRYVPFVSPPPGYYCPSLVLTEYTLFGYVARDWVNFSCRYVGPVIDLDSDGWSDLLDNCPLTWNPSQTNSDSDVLGDACDPCIFDSANDADSDGYCANVDNCPLVENRNQLDADGDSWGDACDRCLMDAANDSDGDGWCAGQDTCPLAYDPDQLDSDSDGIGNACDATPFPEPGEVAAGLAALACLAMLSRSTRARPSQRASDGFA